MSQTLYEEAIAEARRLTEMAEQNAKNKIIDAVTPQIRRLIEQELSGDDMDDDDESEEGDEGDMDALGGGAESVDAGDFSLDLDSISSMPSAAPPIKATTASPSLKMDGGEIEITVGGTKIEIEPADDSNGAPSDDELLLDEPVMEALERMVVSSRTGRRALGIKLERLHRRTVLLRQAMREAKKSSTRSQKRRLAKIFEQLAREAIALRKQVVLAESSAGGRTPETKLVNSIIKEMKDMSRRNGKNVFDFLFEADEDKDQDVESMGMEDEGGDDKPESDVDVDAIKDAVESLAGALGMSLSDEGEGDDEGDEGDEDEEEVALELEAGMPEGSYAKMETDETEEGDMKETVYELDESVLRKALASMRRDRRPVRTRRINEEAVDAAHSFGGGEAGDEMFVDVDEETLLNVLADELGTAKAPKVGGAQLAKESRRSRAALAEAAKLRQQVADYRKVAGQLKGQLVEMNLFNAKLLYANKLMQNRDLSAKQQRAIVEALDNAKTLREAKLLYKSLTESLNKGANRGNLSEGRTRVLGSSSKSARSAQPINEAGGTDRWAVLAGIKKD
jgi:hypothetical protein